MFSGNLYILPETRHNFDIILRYYIFVSFYVSKVQQRRKCGCPLGPFASCWFFILSLEARRTPRGVSFFAGAEKNKAKKQNRGLRGPCIIDAEIKCDLILFAF